MLIGRYGHGGFIHGRCTAGTRPGQTLLVGLSSIGVAGLTTAEYLVRHRESVEIGHVSPEELPAITPFEDGRPRYPTRLYNLTDADLTVLVSELFVPVPAARSFANAVVEWASEGRIENIAIMHGVPVPHGPDEHRVFQVATDEYREQHLEETDIPPLRGGFLDGVPGELISRSMDDRAPPTGALITPAHPPGPDIDAAGLFLDAIDRIYDVAVDRTELQELSEDRKTHYANLAERMSDLEAEPGRQHYGEDRMYM